MPRVTKNIFLMTLVWCAFMTGCNQNDKSADSIRLQWFHQAQFLGFYAAIREKLFPGPYQFEVKQGGPDFRALPLVASGTDFAGVTTADQLIIARDQGFRVKAVFVVYRRNVTGYMVHQNSEIFGPADFVGRTVGMKYGYNTETEYIAMLDQANVDRAQVNETAVKFDLQRFFLRDVDVWPVFVINEPLIAEAQGFPVRVVRPEEYGVRGFADTVFVEESSIEEQPEKVRALCDGLRAGWQWVFDNPDQSLPILLDFNPNANLEHEKRMLEASAPLIVAEDPSTLGQPERVVWSDMSEILLEQGLIGREVQPEEVWSSICFEMD